MYVDNIKQSFKEMVYSYMDSGFCSETCFCIHARDSSDCEISASVSDCQTSASYHSGPTSVPCSSCGISDGQCRTEAGSFLVLTPVLHAHSFIYHRRQTISGIQSVVK